MPSSIKAPSEAHLFDEGHMFTSFLQRIVSRFCSAVEFSGVNERKATSDEMCVSEREETDKRETGNERFLSRAWKKL